MAVPALTYRGALEILGHRQSRLLAKIDALLGLTILGGTASGQFWLMGVLDAKNEGIALIDRLIKAAPPASGDAAVSSATNWCRRRTRWC